jgi:hypothetical protein
VSEPNIGHWTDIEPLPVQHGNPGAPQPDSSMTIGSTVSLSTNRLLLAAEIVMTLALPSAVNVHLASIGPNGGEYLRVLA